MLDTLDPAAAGPVEAARLYCLASVLGYHPEVLSLDDNIEAWRSSWPVPVHAVGRCRLLPRYSAALVPWLRTNASRYDCVVVHSVWGYHLVGVWRALCGVVPYYLILHGGLNSWFRMAYPGKHLKKVAFWRMVTGKAVAGAAAILYLCPEELRVADRAFPIRSKGKVFVPLGTPVRRASAEAFLERFPSLRGKRILLFLGRISHTKGTDVLLESFADAAPSSFTAHLVVCGTDAERRQGALMRRADALGLRGRVTWAGPLFGDDRWPALSAAELVALPSRCDAFPIVVLEALSCGTPVLVSREVNIHRRIEQAGAGVVCDASREGVASAIRGWLRMGPCEVAASRMRAADCHRSEFDLNRAVGMHVEAIRRGLPSSGEIHTGVRRTMA